MHMAGTDKLLNTNPYATSSQHPLYAATPDQTGATYPGTAIETAEIRRRGPERAPGRPQTRTEYIERVLAQIKAAAR
jgi:hypothetical protein